MSCLRFPGAGFVSLPWGDFGREATVAAGDATGARPWFLILLRALSERHATQPTRAAIGARPWFLILLRALSERHATQPTRGAIGARPRRVFLSLPSFADRDLASPRSGDLDPARALRSRTPFSIRRAREQQQTCGWAGAEPQQT